MNKNAFEVIQTKDLRNKLFNSKFHKSGVKNYVAILTKGTNYACICKL